jgi:antitoxin component of MazEF toxin-antitoxin module
MIAKRKIRKIGKDAVILLPKEMLTHLEWEVGDSLSWIATGQDIELTKDDQAAV